MEQRRHFLGLFAVMFVSMFAVSALASPVFDDITGSFSDDFTDESAITGRQNASVGPALTPGARLAQTTWSWAQSYTQASDAVVQSFAGTGATFNMTQSIKACTTCFEMVGLWQKEYRAYRDTILGPGTLTTTYYAEQSGPEAGELDRLVAVPWIERYTGQYVLQTPFLTDMVPGEGYTVTFRSSFCDDPQCGKVSTAPARRDMFADNAEVAQYEVWLGLGKRASKQVCIGQIPNGGFFKERQFTDLTLEPTWPDPLPSPSENKWDFRMMSTLNPAAPTVCNPALAPLPDCAPNCTATLWIESLFILAKGHTVSNTCFVTQADCDALGPGLKPCGCQCLKSIDYPDGIPCGWDAATYYVGSGSYVSPVFDSLSTKTTWEQMFWRFDQNYGGGVLVRTPMALKWRVGNTPNPADWLMNEHGVAESGWYMGTIPMSASPWGGVSLPPPPEIPPYMPDASSTNLLYKNVKAVGRYFQYEVDFTSHYANERFTPEMDESYGGPDRNLHASPSPWLKSVRVYYTPVRGKVVSQLIRPARLKKWGVIMFEPDLASGGVIQIDVLDDQGNPLFANIPNLAGGFSIAALSPERYPAIMLRVWFDNQGNLANRPVLNNWKVTWDVNPEPLRIDRNLLDSNRADRAVISVNLNGERDGTLAVFDAAGQSIKILCRCRFPAGVSTFTWSGSNERGETVAPGIYFISLKAKDVNRIGKLVVK